MPKSSFKRTVVMMDMDGIFGDFYLPCTALLNKLCGKPAKPIHSKDAPCWDFDDLGVTKEEEGKLWKELYQQENFWLNEPEMEPGIVKNAWEKMGSNTSITSYFCSTRQQTLGLTVEDQTGEWLKKFGWKGNPYVIISKKKGLIAAGVKADYFIDDKASNVIDVMKDSPSTKAYFLLRQYQRNELDSVTRASVETGATLRVITHLDSFLTDIVNGA